MLNNNIFVEGYTTATTNNDIDDRNTDESNTTSSNQVESNANPVQHSSRRSIRNANEGQHATSSYVDVLSGHSTLQQYIQQLRQKDEKIRLLEEENKKLCSMLVTKSAESQGRVDELAKELERHAELVAQLQNQLKSQMKPSGAIKRPASHANKKSRKVPTIVAASNGTIASHASAANQKLMTTAKRSHDDTDDVYAKLASFVESNQPEPSIAFNADEQFNVASSQQQSDEALMTEQMFQLMAENPSLLPAFLLSTTAAGMGDMNAVNNDKLEPEAANLLNMFLESTAMLDANGTTVGEFLTDNQQQQQQNQQSMDFEEVMQCVIGKAMNGGGEMAITTDSNSNDVPLVTPPPVSSMILANHSAHDVGGKVKTTAVFSGKSGKHKKKTTPSTGLMASPISTQISKKNNIITSIIKKEHHVPKSTVPPSVVSPSLNNGIAKTSTPLLPANFHQHLHHTNSSSATKPFSSEEQKLADQLEARIDQNILQLGNCSLNTAELAAQCTRLMREYSIGQRLFARTVMCKVSQSQGSLSELLSKPRPWPKLTDKGRDAFRRIFGWISDDIAIELLCQLSPRKVTVAEKIVHPDPSTLLGQPLQADEAEAATIANGMLIDANMGMLMGNASSKREKAQKHPSHQSSSVSTDYHIQKNVKIEKIETAECVVEQMPLTAKQSKQQQQLVPTFGSSIKETTALLGGATGRWRHDDIPKEKIIDIYEMEKAKLLEQESHLNRTVETGMQPTTSGSAGGILDSTSPHALTTANAKIRQTSGTSKTRDEQMKSPPRSARPSSVLSTTSSIEVFKLSMEQYQVADSKLDRYRSLDTDEVVHRVKEFLAKNGISQRHFGETVLGLSQGSVSDLLARPKAWNLLTQKGREPFIRMQIFLEQNQKMMDDDGKEGNYANPKVLLEQEEENSNNILKMETMVDEERVGNDDDGDSNHTDVSQLKLALPPDSPDETAAMDNEEGMVAEEGERSEIDDNLVAAADVGDEDPENVLQNIFAHIKSEQTIADEPEQIRLQQPKNQRNQQKKRGSTAAGRSNPQMTGNNNTDTVTNALETTAKQQQPTLEADKSDEIDTVDVARRVKECLTRNNISQRAFGQHVLKITSGCVSDLLTKPKPWVMLGWKQQTCYAKMLDFLSEPGAVEQLRSDEHQRCELNNALNALKAITAVSRTPMESNKALGSSSSSALADLSVNIDQPRSTVANSMLCANGIDTAACSALQIVTNLANELGVNTPIGTILKNANSPKSTTPVNTSNGSSMPNKRKGTPSSSSSFGMMSSAPPTMVSMDDVIGQPLKKIPRFQRTLITDKQKEALLFIFAHEQRPNSRCIEQLATKLGLSARTVTNWFHNYRTRQKAKEVKDDVKDGFGQTQTSGQTPAQVLARALNANDAKTTNWFKELAELLRHHSDATVDVDGIGAARGSTGTASADSSPPFQMANCNDEEEFDDEFAEHSKNRAAQLWEASVSYARSRPPNVSSNTATGASQLDRVIARLMAGKAQ